MKNILYLLLANALLISTPIAMEADDREATKNTDRETAHESADDKETSENDHDKESKNIGWYTATDFFIGSENTQADEKQCYYFPSDLQTHINSLTEEELKNQIGTELSNFKKFLKQKYDSNGKDEVSQDNGLELILKNIEEYLNNLRDHKNTVDPLKTYEHRSDLYDLTLLREGYTFELPTDIIEQHIITTQKNLESLINSKVIKKVKDSYNSELESALTAIETNIEKEKMKFSLHKEYEIYENTFKNIQESTTLNLARREINKIDSSYFLYPHITKLNIQDNQIKSIPPEIRKLDQLISLNISNNPISQLPDEISSLSHLETLLAGKTKFINFPKVLLKLSNLTAINFSNSSLENIPEDIALLKSLKELHISGTKVKTLPIKSLRELPNLKKLAIHDCKELTLETIQSLIEWRDEIQKGKPPLFSIDFFDEDLDEVLSDMQKKLEKK